MSSSPSFRAPAPRPPLRRRAGGRLIAGVAAGTARHLGADPWHARLAFVLLALTGGAGVVLYLWLWFLVPEETVDGATPEAVPPLRDRVPELVGRVREGGWTVLLAGVVAGVGLLLAADGLGVPVDWAVAGPVAVLVIGLGLAWMQLDLTGTAPRGRASRLVRLLLGTALVLLGVVAVLLGAVSGADLWLGLLVAVALLAGAALVAMPYVLAAQRRRDAERTAAAVRSQRDEIAAHLHDSVLQSLALIQRRSDDRDLVLRTARAQERELRHFLALDRRRPAGTLSERLEAHAAVVENEQGRRIEVVAVGEASGAWLDPIVAAAREAMLNAARHAGDAQVYAEVSAGEDGRPVAEVFVRDRGSGFDPEAVPEDRLGLRESVVGRMRRAGGRAGLRSDARGTEVHLSLAGPAASDAGGGDGGSGAGWES